jgi:hypothetical protein
MHGWWWPGRQVVVVAPLAVIVVAMAVDRLPALAPVLAVGTVLGALTWLWTALEAATRRRTLVVDFEQTANPWYRIWRLVLPDGRDPAAAVDLFIAGWGLLGVIAVVLGWRWCGVGQVDVALRQRVPVLFSRPNVN